MEKQLVPAPSHGKSASSAAYHASRARMSANSGFRKVMLIGMVSQRHRGPESV